MRFQQVEMGECKTCSLSSSRIDQCRTPVGNTELICCRFPEQEAVMQQCTVHGMEVRQAA